MRPRGRQKHTDRSSLMALMPSTMRANNCNASETPRHNRVPRSMTTTARKPQDSELQGCLRCLTNHHSEHLWSKSLNKCRACNHPNGCHTARARPRREPRLTRQSTGNQQTHHHQRSGHQRLLLMCRAYLIIISCRHKWTAPGSGQKWTYWILVASKP